MEQQLTDDTQRSPTILAISWGRIQADGLAAGKDLKLFPGWGPGVGLV
jgi:hypothetical protein